MNEWHKSYNIIRTEIIDVEDMIKNEDDSDKEKFEDYLSVVRNIFSKIQAE